MAYMVCLGLTKVLFEKILRIPCFPWPLLADSRDISQSYIQLQYTFHSALRNQEILARRSFLAGSEDFGWFLNPYHEITKLRPTPYDTSSGWWLVS